MDELYGLYKTSSYVVADDIVAERIKAQEADDPSVTLKLDFCDLGRMSNGKEGDPIEKRPFEHAFNPDRIKRATATLGLNPINLKVALKPKRGTGQFMFWSWQPAARLSG